MSDQNDNKPAVIHPASDPKDRNFQRPNDAPLGKEDNNNNNHGPEGFVNLNRSDAEEVTQSGVASNKGEEDGGAGS